MYTLALLFAAAALVSSLLALPYDCKKRKNSLTNFFRTSLTLFVRDREPETINLALAYATLGRQKRCCDYHIRNDRWVSRLHAILWYENGRFHIRPYRPSTILSDWEAWYTAPRRSRLWSLALPAFLCRLTDALVRRLERIEMKFRRKSSPKIYAHAELVPADGTEVDGLLDVTLSNQTVIRLNTLS